MDGGRKACGWKYPRAPSARNMFGDESATEAVLIHGRKGRSPRERRPTLECAFPWLLYIFPLSLLLLFISCGSEGKEEGGAQL